MRDDSKKTIFISYSWKNERIADSFCKFGDNLFEIKRDKRDINYIGSIKTFMKKIRTTDFTLMIISDDYLKSKNCMNEVWELLNVNNYLKKILPIIVNDAKKIFSAYNRLEYVEYWENEYNSLKERIKKLDPITIGKQTEELTIIGNIKNNISTFLFEVSDLNAINVIEDITEDDFATILTVIEPKKKISSNNEIEKETFPKDITSNELIKMQILEIKNISNHYPLSQAVFACEELLTKKLKEENTRKLRILQQKLSSNIDRSNSNMFDDIQKEIKELTLSQKRVNINIDYISISMDGSRTIYIPSCNQLIIVLSKQLLEDKIGRQKIKNIIAHELGHIVLNFNEVISEKSLLGSNVLKKNEKLDEKASYFANELLNLYEDNV